MSLPRNDRSWSFVELPFKERTYMPHFKSVVLAALLVSGVCYGQASGPPGMGGPRQHGFGPEGFGPGGFGPHGGKVVTGAPYSATITNEFTQTLAGGNTIQRSNSGQVARDSQGRTYEQQTISAGPLAQSGPVTLTFISDPVAGFSYVLNAQTKVASRRALRTPPANANSANHPSRSDAGSSSPDRVVTDLGTQTVGGVNAQGKSITHTIAAGAMGNAQPIVSTNETWYSPDLQIVVLAKRNDPRAGQSTYTVSNIQRTDPAASLFQVPSDYAVQDAAQGRRVYAGIAPGETPSSPQN